RPRVAIVLGAEQPLRRTACVPDAWLIGVTGRQPEDEPDAALEAVARRERRRLRRLGPRLTRIGRSKHGWTEMTGARSGKDRTAIARIGYDVAGDVAEEGRPFDRPFLTTIIGSW